MYNQYGVTVVFENWSMLCPILYLRKGINVKVSYNQQDRLDVYVTGQNAKAIKLPFQWTVKHPNIRR